MIGQYRGSRPSASTWCSAPTSRARSARATSRPTPTASRARFFRTLQAYRKGAPPPYPYPVEHCAYCDWWARCRDRRRADDHLSLVAGIRRAQAIQLEAAGVRTRRRARRRAGGRLGAADLRADARRAAPAGVAAGRSAATPTCRCTSCSRRRPGPRLRAAAAARRRATCSSTSRAIRSGAERGPGVPVRLARREDGYQPLWAHDRAQERAAFERSSTGSRRGWSATPTCTSTTTTTTSRPRSSG